MRELEEMKRQWQAEHGNRCGTDCQSVLRCGTDCQSVLRCGTDCQSVLRRRVPYESALREQLSPLARAVMQQIEGWLDQGLGSCCLRRPDAARIVAGALRHFDGNHYELGCYVVMPNHVHSIIRPLQSEREPLEKILQSRKRHTARKINTALRRSGSLWQEESFDRIVREEEHLFRLCSTKTGSFLKIGVENDR